MLLGNAGERRKKPSQETKGGDAPGREEWAEPPTPQWVEMAGDEEGGGRWA